MNTNTNYSREFKCIQANRIPCDMMELDQDGYIDYINLFLFMLIPILINKGVHLIMI